MLDRIEFLLSEGFVALRRNSWMTFAAITTCAMALFLTGGVAFAYRGVSEYAGSLPERFEIRVFLNDEVPKDRVKKVQTTIQKLPGVRSVQYVSKESAWEKFKKDNPAYPTEGIDNPLPEAFTVRLRDVDQADIIAGSIKKVPDVAKDGVLYLRQEREMLSQFLSMLRLAGIALGGMMLITSGILIYNAIQMTIKARAREFRIMELVGANGTTITTPLLIEGLAQGIFGGLIASLLVQATHWILRGQLQGFQGIVKMGELSFPLVLGTLTALGAVYGLLCSGLAVRGRK